MFLKKMYQQWRPMFYFIILLMAAQVFFMYKAVETVPFFLFNMYSTKQLPADTTYRTIVYLNGKRFDPRYLTGREKETLFGSLSFFRRLKKNNFMATDSITISKRLKGKLPASWYPMAIDRLANQKISEPEFLKWWAGYLSRVSHRQVDSFSIIQCSVAWKPSFHIIDDTVSLIRYAHGK